MNDRELLELVVNQIQLDQIATADASKGIAHVTHFGHSVDTVIANARRLAACWNACEGISAEHLEDDAVHKLIRDRDLLLAQRDELLKALQEMVDGDKEAIEEAEALGVPFPEEMLATHRRAVAAIAKAGGAA